MNTKILKSESFTGFNDTVKALSHLRQERADHTGQRAVAGKRDEPLPTKGLLTCVLSLLF